MLPPGRARLATNPCVTGSFTSAKTTRTDEVARFIAAVATEPEQKTTSGARESNSEAISWTRCELPPAQRTSILTLWPSVQPS